MSDFDEEDEGLSALLKRFGGEEGDTSTETHQDAAEETHQDAAEETSEEGHEATEETAEEHFADDTHYVTVGEGEGARKLTVKELRDLAAREDEINTRSQEATAAVEKWNSESNKALLMVQTVLKEARKEFGVFAELDKPGGWATARSKLGDEAFAQLQRDYQTARSRVLYLEHEGNKHVEAVRAHQTELNTKALKERDAALEKDATFKEGWVKVKPELVEYASKNGLPAGVVDSLLNPAAVSMLYKAMMFDRGMARATSSVKPLVKGASKTTLKPGSKPASTDAATAKVEAARKKLRASGSLDDAEAAFMARFG